MDFDAPLNLEFIKKIRGIELGKYMYSHNTHYIRFVTRSNEDEETLFHFFIKNTGEIENLFLNTVNPFIHTNELRELGYLIFPIFARVEKENAEQYGLDVEELINCIENAK